MLRIAAFNLFENLLETQITPLDRDQNQITFSHILLLNCPAQHIPLTYASPSRLMSLAPFITNSIQICVAVEEFTFALAR